jgi:hypothetical protein
MKRECSFLVVVVWLVFVIQGYAQLDAWRTQVQVSTGSGTNTQFDFDGGLNATQASKALARGDTALAEASSALNDEGYVPTLRARATASPTRAQAVAWGVQGYVNTSSSPLATSLLLNLSANLTGGNDVDARIYLFQSENFEWSFDPGTILFESSSVLWPGFEAYANNLGPDGFDIDINNFTGAVSEQRNFEFTVAPGGSFYVWARLVTTADNAGVVDAFSTLTASFSNTTGLTPAVVPEPAAAGLLLFGLAGLLALRRRQPSAV